METRSERWQAYLFRSSSSTALHATKVNGWFYGLILFIQIQLHVCTLAADAGDNLKYSHRNMFLGQNYYIHTYLT